MALVVEASVPRFAACMQVMCLTARVVADLVQDTRPWPMHAGSDASIGRTESHRVTSRASSSRGLAHRLTEEETQPMRTRTERQRGAAAGSEQHQLCCLATSFCRPRPAPWAADALQMHTSTARLALRPQFVTTQEHYDRVLQLCTAALSCGPAMTLRIRMTKRMTTNRRRGRGAGTALRCWQRPEAPQHQENAIVRMRQLPTRSGSAWPKWEP